MLDSYNQRPIAPTYLLEGHYELERVGRPWDMVILWCLGASSIGRC